MIKVGVCFLIFTLVLLGFYSFDLLFEGDAAGQVNFAYFEDGTGQMMLSDVSGAASRGEFKQVKNGIFTFGRSRSVFWIRILAQDAALLKDYIALYCPNVQDVRLYTPEKNGYIASYSGWGNSHIRNDEGLTYPVFHLDQNSVGGKPIYLRVQSCYSHNYIVEFYTPKDLNSFRTADLFANSFLFGMLFTIIIVNLIIYFKLKSKICLIFALCVFLISMHQGCSSGIYNIILRKHADSLMCLSIEIGLMYIISYTVFFIVFSDVKTCNRGYYRWLLGLIGACLLDYPICSLDMITANLIAHILSVAVPVFVLYLSFRLYLKGQKQQRIFITGWAVTIALYVLAMLVGEGAVQINYVSIHLPVPLITMVVVSVIFTVALTEHTRQIQIERLNIQRQCQIALERAQRTEMALMQTQIKPHFLYNTLSAIECLCEIDGKKAQAAVADFADYLRTNIDFTAETRLIPIEKELENVRHYLSLEQMRFDERLRVQYDIKTGDFMLPPLVVQPIVENAVRHGVTKKLEGGTVSITVGETKLSYMITVEDDGVGFEPEYLGRRECAHAHVGINNVRKRLIRQCNGTLVIDSRVGDGTTAVITIPKGVGN